MRGKLLVLFGVLFSLSVAHGIQNESDDWAKESKAFCDQDLGSKLTVSLMTKQLPKALEGSNFQLDVNGTLHTVPWLDQPRIEIGVLGKTHEKDGKKAVDYKLTRKIEWTVPGTLLGGVSLEYPESAPITTTKAGICLDFGVQSIPLTVVAGEAKDHPDVQDFVDLAIKYELDGKAVEYRVDLQSTAMKSKDEGKFVTEILVPTNKEKNTKFSYEIRYMSKSKGLQTVKGNQTHSGKKDSEDISFAEAK